MLFSCMCMIYVNMITQWSWQDPISTHTPPCGTVATTSGAWTFSTLRINRSCTLHITPVTAPSHASAFVFAFKGQPAKSRPRSEHTDARPGKSRAHPALSSASGHSTTQGRLAHHRLHCGKLSRRVRQIKPEQRGHHAKQEAIPRTLRSRQKSCSIDGRSKTTINTAWCIPTKSRAKLQHRHRGCKPNSRSLLARTAGHSITPCTSRYTRHDTRPTHARPPAEMVYRLG